LSEYPRDIFAKVYLIFAAIGIALAIYHAYDEITQNFDSCNISSTVSCGGVFESGITSIFGVPFYVLGLVWFPLALLLGFFAVKRVYTTTRLNPMILLPFLMVGNLFTLYLWYLELGVIGIICPVCVSLYVINYALTVLAAKALIL
jgi:uncharacterized membrane protein